MNYINFYVNSNGILTTNESLLLYYELNQNIGEEGLSVQQEVFPIEISIINKIKSKIKSVISHNLESAKVTINIIDDIVNNPIYNIIVNEDEYIERIRHCFDDIIDSTVEIQVKYSYLSNDNDKVLSFLENINYDIIDNASDRNSLPNNKQIHTICILNASLALLIQKHADKTSNETSKYIIKNYIAENTLNENHEIDVFWSHTSIPILN